MSLVERVKSIASKRKGWNLKETAENAGLSTNSIYKWNKQSPSLKSLSAVADALGVSVDELRGIEHKKEPKINPDPTFADLGMPYGGKIPEDLKDTYVDLAKSYFKRHPEMLNDKEQIFMYGIEEMSLETRENYDKLMQYLMNYAMFDCHIGVEFTNKLPSYAPSVSYNKPGKLIIMNANWLHPTQIPFQLAHEIGHVLHENEAYFNLNDKTKYSGEARENIFAIKLLQRYCTENEFNFSSIYQFARCFGVPQECYYLLVDIA